MGVVGLRIQGSACVRVRAVRLALLSLALASGLAGSFAAAGRGAGSPTTVTTAAAPTTTSGAREVLVVEGHGWGHGLGLSQWGAYGYALHGWTFDRILAHYYTGTTLGTAPVAAVRVLVADERKPVVSGAAAWTIVDATGARTVLAAGRTLALTRTPSVDGVALTPPLTLSSAGPLTVDGRAYRGRLTVLAAGATVQVVDVVALEAYVKGVVPAEMPSGWPAAALQAQAVAARSYALANLQKGRPYDLYGDSRSQVYGGVAAETPTAVAAVASTGGRVVLWGGRVAVRGGLTSTAARPATRTTPPRPTTAGAPCSSTPRACSGP